MVLGLVMLNVTKWWTKSGSQLELFGELTSGLENVVEFWEYWTHWRRENKGTSVSFWQCVTNKAELLALEVLHSSPLVFEADFRNSGKDQCSAVQVTHSCLSGSLWLVLLLPDCLNWACSLWCQSQYTQHWCLSCVLRGLGACYSENFLFS